MAENLFHLTAKKSHLSLRPQKPAEKMTAATNHGHSVFVNCFLFDFKPSNVSWPLFNSGLGQILFQISSNSSRNVAQFSQRFQALNYVVILN